jgi:hypothetical protein
MQWNDHYFIAADNGILLKRKKLTAKNGSYRYLINFTKMMQLILMSL